MNTTIILKKDSCWLCDAAVREFIDDGHKVETYFDISEIDDADRRNKMMTDLLSAGGHQNMRPLVFIYDRFIPWQPKKGIQK